MKFTKLGFILLILIISIGVVSATEDTNDTISNHNIDEALKTNQENIGYTFTDLNNDINAVEGIFDVQHDYRFNNETDDNYVTIHKSNFIINGNNHKFDGNNQSRILSIFGTNVTINNLIFSNGNFTNIGGLRVEGSATLNNVTFINNTANNVGSLYVQGEVNCFNCNFIDSNAAKDGSAIYSYNSTTNVKNSKFIDGSGKVGSAISGFNSVLNVEESYFTSKGATFYASVYCYNSDVSIDNCIFTNITSNYSAGISMEESNITIRDSIFNNLRAETTSGAIAIKWLRKCVIENTTFINVTSNKNAGAIFTDDNENNGTVFIKDCDFISCNSDFGGAIIQLGGNISIIDSNFFNNSAKSYGGAIYTSYANLNLINSTLDNNRANNYSAIYFDIGDLFILNSNITNKDPFAWTVYLNDAYIDFENSIFDNNKIYGNFIESYRFENNTLNNTTFSIDNQNYISFVENTCLILNLTNNVIVVDNYPSRFDLREWGWETPVKNQGIMGACWAFAFVESMESSLQKATGIEYDLSENNMQNLRIKYSPVGKWSSIEGGSYFMALGYSLSWNGVIFEDDDEYDELGKASRYIESENRIHLQDAYIIFPNSTDYVFEVKKAVINYGAVAISYTYDIKYYNENTSAHYTNDKSKDNHGVAIIGWDDDYSASNFLVSPPGNGAWICKNSWGTEWGDNGYFYLSYYDTGFFEKFVDESDDTFPLVAFIFNNTINYHINYQTDITGIYEFDGNYSQYSNEFDAVSDDLIAAVGTYFRDEGVNYSFDIYVNGELMLSQRGVSDYAGYKTIILNKYITLKKGDKFKVVFKNNMLPYQFKSRQHYMENVSMVSADGETWIDLAPLNKTVCLKVYTVADDSIIMGNNDWVVDYGSKSNFSVCVLSGDGHAVSGAQVNFTINGKTTTVLSDNEGIAKFEISETPGSYIIETTYNNKTYQNSVVINLNLKTCKVIDNKNIIVDYASGSYFSVKVVSHDGKVAAEGASVKFYINGKTKSVKTDKNGIAKIKITDIPKKYLITTTFNAKDYKNTVTVKQVLKTNRVNAKKTDKKFTLKAKLKINGKSVKGKLITFKFNGKTYKTKTNAKGIAKATIKQNVIKKLRKGRTYTFKVTYIKDTIKSSVKIK